MLHAEYDPVADHMLAVLDDTDVLFPRRATGAPATPGVEPLVLPLRSHWPDPFVADLPDLLGPMVVDYDREAGVLVRRWPAATYTPEAVRAARRRALDALAGQVLAGTDWTLIRQLETGRPVPAPVAAHRAAVRAWHERTTAQLAAADLAHLVDVTRWQLPADLLEVPA